MKINYIFLFSVWLTGCGTPYVQPPLEGNATFEFSQRGLVTYRIFAKGDDCSGADIIPKENNILQGGNKPLVIAANREFAIATHASNGSITNHSACNLTVSFRPAPNGKYRAQYVSDIKTCTMTLVRLAQQNGIEQEIHEPTFKKRVGRKPFDEYGSFCEPLESK